MTDFSFWANYLFKKFGLSSSLSGPVLHSCDLNCHHHNLHVRLVWLCTIALQEETIAHCVMCRENDRLPDPLQSQTHMHPG